MKKIIPAFLVACCATISAFGQEIPGEWTKDFEITLKFSGSMSGGFTDIKFTYDSCVYTNSGSHSDPTERKFYLLKADDRAAILKKMHELKADKIKAEHGVYPVNDGWSQSICFNSLCIEGGTSVEMDEKNKNRFLDAYRYLEDFASNHAKKKLSI